MSKRQVIETHNLTGRDSSENDCVGMGTKGKGFESYLNCCCLSLYSLLHHQIHFTHINLREIQNRCHKQFTISHPYLYAYSHISHFFSSLYKWVTGQW